MQPLRLYIVGVRGNATTQPLPARAQALAAALPNLRALRKLDLADNPIGDEGALAIAEALPRCARLRSLGLACNGLAALRVRSVGEAAAGVWSFVLVGALPPTAELQAILEGHLGAFDATPSYTVALTEAGSTDAAKVRQLVSISLLVSISRPVGCPANHKSVDRHAPLRSHPRLARHESRATACGERPLSAALPAALREYGAQAGARV